MSRQKQLIPLARGERLRQQREALGHELADVAAQLRIDEPVMKAIEEDRLAHMAALYQRGYIRSYARFLGFDESEIAEMLEEVSDEPPELHAVFPSAGHSRNADRWIRATSYALASLLIGTLAWQFTHEAVRLSQDRGQPAVRLAQDDPDSANGGEGSSPQAARHVNASIAALEKLPLQRKRDTGAGEQAWAAIQSKEGAPAEHAGPTAVESVLGLAASGDSWVEIRDATGKQLEMDLVRGGTSKQYQGVAPFNIQFGRASALQLTHNGEAVDIEAFTRGDVTQMVLLANGTGRAEIAGSESRD